MNNTNLLTSHLSLTRLDLTAFKANIALYAAQAVFWARQQAVKVAQANLGKFAGADQENAAVAKGMELYRVFEAPIPVLNMTELDDIMVEQLMHQAVKKIYGEAKGLLDDLGKQATTAPTPASDPVPSVPDTTFTPPVTDDSTLGQGGLS